VSTASRVQLGVGIAAFVALVGTMGMQYGWLEVLLLLVLSAIASSALTGLAMLFINWANRR
jgi:hypothetical protein